MQDQLRTFIFLGLYKLAVSLRIDDNFAMLRPEEYFLCQGTKTPSQLYRISVPEQSSYSPPIEPNVSTKHLQLHIQLRLWKDFKTSDQPTRTDFQFELTVAFLNNFRRTFLNPYSMNVSEPTHESASNTVELSRNHSSSEHDDSDTSQRSQLDTPETTLKIIAEDEMCCGESDDEHFIDLESLANNSSSRISFSLAESSECLESSEFSTDNNSSREMQIEGENQAPERPET